MSEHRTSNPLVALARTLANSSVDERGVALAVITSPEFIRKLADEIERLTADRDRYWQWWEEHGQTIDRLRAALRGALECVECNDAQGAETIINVALRPADEPIRDSVLAENIRGRVSNETSAECNHDGYSRCRKCGKTLVIDCHECGAAQNGEPSL